MLGTVKLLDATEGSTNLTERLVSAGAIPAKAFADAAHIALAVAYGVEYLLSWNCRHIANATMRAKIDQVCLDSGYAPIIICTPDELLEP